jgi:hypothetical protein
MVLSALLGREGGRPRLEQDRRPRRELHHHEACLAEHSSIKSTGGRLQRTQQVLRHSYAITRE